MKKVVVGKDGKPLMAARRDNFDANRPGVNEHGDLIGKHGNTRKAARQVNVENNAIVAVVNNIAATSQNDALNKNDSVIHVSGHNECTYGVLSTDDQVTPANDVSTSAMKNINMIQNVLENEKPATFVTSLSDDANTNNEDTQGAANHATKEPGVFGTHATVAVGTGMKQSFASIFKTQSVSKSVRLTTMTSEFVQGANVAIPLAAVEEVSQRFENTLYGYFIGKRLAFPLVETYVKNALAKFGLERTMLTNGFFFFQFATREGMERVLENGPWLIRLVPIFLNIWTPNTVLKKDTITSAPIWVKLHHVPIVAFSEIGLSLITSQLGRPIMLEAYTSTMCQKSWGRNLYARALVEVSSLAALKESLVVAIPFPNGTGHSLETVEVVDSTPIEDEGGFTQVKRKNGKGKQDGKAKQVANIHLTKPKLKLVYREVQKPPTNKNDKATTSNSDSSLRKDNQPTMQPKDVINIVSLHNSFEYLMEKDKDSLEDVLDDDDEEVEEVYIEDNGRRAKQNKGASTPFDQDFNVSLSADEKSFGPFYIDTGMRDFQDCVKAIEVSDVNKTGLRFTWNQNPKGEHVTLKKIDRIMANLDFYSSFVGSSAFFLPYRISDHSPAVLRIPMESTSNPRPFKFSNLLVHNNRFKDIVANGWNVSVSGFWMFKVVKHLKMLNKPLRKLLHDLGNLHENVKKLWHELEMVQTALDLDPSNLELREEEVVYLQAFKDASLLEENFLMHKAKVEWLKLGDANTAYFHKVVKSQATRNRIDCVTTTNGVNVDGDQV
ncbi:zinc knuckle CX2CX4HX4C containing protein, partial [Tanacetum coccineum]